MAGVVGIIASLTVLGLSLVITRIATVALSLTGLSWEAARFQARSAFTGTGFTTSEAEKVVSHPLRRRIIMWLMVARSAGFVSIIISLILTFGSGGDGGAGRLLRLWWLVGGVALLWVLASSAYLERWMRRVISRALGRWTNLEVRDYADLLKLSGDYTVREIGVREEDWLAEKRLRECRLMDEGVLVLGIYRPDGEYIGAPRADTRVFAGDTIVLYGRASALRRLDVRRDDAGGEAEHEEARSEQQREEAEQARKEHEYEQARRRTP